MFRRGWWIATAGILTAVVVWSFLATRGPATGRAPSRPPAPAGGPEDSRAIAEGDGIVRVAVRVLPGGSSAEWTLEVRDSMGGRREERGRADRECTIGPLPSGRARCSVRARGCVGESRWIEVERGREATATMTLRRFGSVVGIARCEGAPVAGVLVTLAIPRGMAVLRMELMPEDFAAGIERGVETDSNGRYRIDDVPSGQGFMLVAAGFDYPPVRVGPVEVDAGKETTADFVLVLGTHLAGRIVDLKGQPCKGATVNVLRAEPRRGVVQWMDEARARTDDDGRFVTPALAGLDQRMLKAWVVVDGVQQVVQHETSPPERGTKDVGTLSPHPGIVQFECESAVGEPSCSLTVAVNGDPPGVGPMVVLSGIAFDGDGRIRLAGLPIGEGSYTAMAKDRSVGDGTFRTTGADMVVRIPPLREPAARPPPPSEQLIVEVSGAEEDALLALIADGSFVMLRRIGKGAKEPVVEKVHPGRYTLFVSAGDRCGQQEVTVVEGRDTRASITPDRIGRSVTVLVWDEGKPAAGAKVGVRGFRRDPKGLKSAALRTPWAEAGADGRAVVRGLPPDVTVLGIVAAAKDGFGRACAIEIAGVDEVTVDLSRAPEDDR